MTIARNLIILITILVLSFLWLTPSVPVRATQLSINNVKPSLDTVSLTNTTGVIVTTVLPEKTYFVNFTARDNNSLSDLNSITVKVYYEGYTVPSKSTHYNFTWTQATNWTSDPPGYVVSYVTPTDFSVASFNFSLGFKLDETAMLYTTTTWHVNVTSTDSAGISATNDTITFTGTDTMPLLPGVIVGGGAPPVPSVNVLVDLATGAVTSTTALTVEKGTLTIPKGTFVTDAEGYPLSTSIATLYTPTTAATVGAIAAYEFGPSGTTFVPPIDLVIAYDPADLPAGFSESDLMIRMWDGTAWVDLATTVDTVAHTATAKVSHCTIFALFAAPPVAPPPTPTPPPVVTPTPPPITPTPTPAPPFPVIPLVIVIALVVAVIIVAVAYVVLRRRP